MILPGFRALCAILLAGVLLAACASHDEPGPAPSSSSSSACGQEFLDGLNQRERLAQLLMVGVKNADDAVDVITHEQVGGIFIGGWTDMSIFDRIKRIRQAADHPVMVAIDEEGGRVTRLGGDAMPSARRSAQTMTPAEVREMARNRGKRMAKLGITADFAPDVDVSAQADDGPIGDRSYSDDPRVVTRYARAFARGLHDAGILPVIKHFPGHGHAKGDSHTGLVTTPPLSKLVDRDLVPYKKLADLHPLGVMIGHLDVPGLTKDAQPASLSPRAVELLRTGYDGKWQPFDGPVFTDDLSGMQAITDNHGIDEAVTLALAAGADVALWLTTDEVPDVLDHLVSATKDGALEPDEINESVLRIARAKGILDCDPSAD